MPTPSATCRVVGEHKLEVFGTLFLNKVAGFLSLEVGAATATSQVRSEPARHPRKAAIAVVGIEDSRTKPVLDHLEGKHDYGKINLTITLMRRKEQWVYMLIELSIYGSKNFISTSYTFLE